MQLLSFKNKGIRLTTIKEWQATFIWLEQQNSLWATNENVFLIDSYIYINIWPKLRWSSKWEQSLESRPSWRKSSPIIESIQREKW